jgi:hypothetical protein
MNIPGFTAEVSLYRTRDLYRAMARVSNALIDGGTAVPQSLALLKCLQGCHNVDSPDYCVQHCYWKDNIEGGGGAGGGSGGGGQSCTPGCGPCHADPDSPTGGYRTCIRHDCSTYDIGCRTWPRGGRPVATD